MLKHAQRAVSAADGDLHPRYQNMPRRLLHHHLPLNVSTLDSSKHSVGGTSASASPAGTGAGAGAGALPPAATPASAPGTVLQPLPKIPNGTPAGAAAPPLRPASVLTSAPRACVAAAPAGGRAATEEALTSLALLCLVSLLLALLALLFLLRISSGGGGAGAGGGGGGGGPQLDELAVVYEVTLALCALTLSLNLCCLLVCAIQFLFAVKLVHAPTPPAARSNQYLQKAAVTRVCAVAGFFISIPVFLTGIILYTFVHFQSTPAIVGGVLVGAGIVFCGAAMLHNVFVWQREKTCVLRALNSTLAAHTHAAHTHAAHAHAAHNLTHTSLNTSNGLILTGAGAGVGVGNGHGMHGAGGGAGGAGWTPTAAPHSRARSLLLHQPPSQPQTQPQPQPPYTIRPPTSTPPGGGGGGEGVPAATLDLSHPDLDPHTHPHPHELSTLV